MLRAILGFSWRNRKTNQELYGELHRITSVLLTRTLRFIGHAWRRKEELAHNCYCGSHNKGRENEVDQLRKDTGLPTDELKTCMNDREEWEKNSRK